MQFYKNSDITDFFDVSIVLPFYKKFQEYKRVLPKNLSFFQRNGIELIIVLDSPDEELELINFLNEFPFLNSRVIINRKAHEWRNPAKPLNVGIRNSNYKYIFVASPETEFLTDVIYQLRYILQYYPESFAIGQVAFLDLEDEPSLSDILKYSMYPFGSIMVEKKHLEKIGGYWEMLSSWGGDDDNIRTRLELAGIRKMFVPQAIAIHREENSDEHKSRSKKNALMPITAYKSIFYPHEPFVNETNWGCDFNEVAYSWSSRNSRRDQYINYSKQFKKYWIKNDDVFQKKYKIIALIQVKNEIIYIPSVLTDLDKYCDGIILLDDGSSDGTYEAALSDKLLLKIQKESDILFDDLKLRNILLELASFLSTEWLFFFDADERFDERFSDLRSIAKRTDIDCVCFYAVHLWNNKFHFRKDVPENKDGILPRLRMFRNYGPLQINSNRVLHFPATPFIRNRLNAPILILHHGNIKAETRKMKYNRYTLQDKEGKTQGYSFDYLLENDVSLENINNIQAETFGNNVIWQTKNISE